MIAEVLDAVVYPESEGKPMADDTLQWDWMVVRTQCSPANGST